MNGGEQPQLGPESAEMLIESRALPQPSTLGTPALPVGPPSSSIQPEPSVQLHIEELWLDGFAPHDRYDLGKAVERELMRLCIEGGVPAALTNGGEIARLDAGAFAVTPGSTAADIGAQVAQAIYFMFRR
jgi:hypothetical protein